MKLKPCPWCGETPRLVGGHGCWQVKCGLGLNERCPCLLLEMRCSPTRKLAIAKWNTRKEVKG